MKVWNFIKISLQHLAITCQPDLLSVVVHFMMNELFKPRPVLFIKAGNVVSVDVGYVCFNHGICASASRLCPSWRHAARALAMAAPIPLDAPVTTATCLLV